MLESAEADGRALCVQTEKEVRDKNGALMNQLRERTAETVANAAEEAKGEAEEMRKNAFLNKRAAEKIVIRGLMSKCR